MHRLSSQMSDLDSSCDDARKDNEIIQVLRYDIEAEPLIHGDFTPLQPDSSPSSNPLFKVSRIFFKALRVVAAKSHVCSLRYRKWSPPTTLNASTTSPSSTSSVVKSYDGLRGLACYFVFNFHFLYPYSKAIYHNYGSSAEDVATNYLHQLPFIVLLIRGRAMVSLFFAISGYVLSNGYLSATQHGQWSSSQSRLSSLVLRRWMRLYLPCTCSTFLVMLAAYCGLFERGRLLMNSEWMYGNGEEHPPMLPHFSEQIQHYAQEWWSWSSPWTWEWYYNLYDPHIWTIPFEFRDSLVLFLLLVALTRIRPAWRIIISFLCASYAFSCGHWDVGIFIFGAITAMFHITFSRASTPQPTLSPEKPSLVSPHFTRLALAFKITLFILGLYLLSCPDEDPELTPGYRTLAALTPAIYRYKCYFWFGMGAPLILWSIELLHPIRSLLELPIPQYLGKISYAFYLVHGPLLHSVGWAIQPVIWRLLGANGQETTARWLIGLLFGYLIMLTLAISFGHLFYVFVDKKLVAFARRVEKMMSTNVK